MKTIIFGLNVIVTVWTLGAMAAILWFGMQIHFDFMWLVWPLVAAANALVLGGYVVSLAAIAWLAKR